MNRFVVLTLILILIGAHHGWKHRSVRQPAGIVVHEEPLQTLYPENQPIIKHNDLVLQPLAAYKIRARVISTERYRLDHGSAVAPIDVCVSWGLLSSNTILNELSFSQSGRFCYYRWTGPPPASPEVIQSHVANMHLIPAESWVKDALYSLRPGQIIELQGDLVEVQSPDGGRWRSSLSRTDTGNGACEVMYVRSVVH